MSEPDSGLGRSSPVRRDEQIDPPAEVIVEEEENSNSDVDSLDEGDENSDSDSSDNRMPEAVSGAQLNSLVEFSGDGKQDIHL